MSYAICPTALVSSFCHPSFSHLSSGLCSSSCSLITLLLQCSYYYCLCVEHSTDTLCVYSFYPDKFIPQSLTAYFMRQGYNLHAKNMVSAFYTGMFPVSEHHIQQAVVSIMVEGRKRERKGRRERESKEGTEGGRMRETGRRQREEQKKEGKRRERK